MAPPHSRRGRGRVESTQHSPEVDARPRNAILRALPSDDWRRIGPQLQTVQLAVREVVVDVARPLDWAYFPEDCVVSIVSVMTDGTAIETATVGFEGFIGLPLLFGTDRTTTQAFCQVPGRAWRLSAAAFVAEIERAPIFSRMLNRYAQALLTLVGQSSACNRLHHMTERCARWLLHCHDRVGDGVDRFPLTHQFMSQMLGVRRASVTEALGKLHKRGAIDYAMGMMTIADRPLLETASCECYAIVRREFDRLLDSPHDTPPVRDPLALRETSRDGKNTVSDGAPRGES